MPRIRQLTDKYAAEDAEKARAAFQVAIGMLPNKSWYPSNRELESDMEVSRTTVGTYRKNPEDMPVSAMKRFVALMKPDISVVLKFLGYSDKEIRKFVRENAN
nr:MAG TPA: bacterial regulatory protein [Caudoviricetes sp.]